MIINVNVNMDSPEGIIKRHGIDKDGRVTTFLRDEVDRYSDPYVPMDRGVLKNNKTYPSNHEIKYNSPYAHYMYKGKMYISPKLGVSGIPLRESGRWWSPKGEKKVPTNIDLHYNGAPKRGPEWDKRMLNDRKQDIIRDVNNFIRNGG